jgi:hypothetical protein
MGRLHGAQQELSVLVVPAMSRAMICDDHEVVCDAFTVSF